MCRKLYLSPQILTTGSLGCLKFLRLKTVLRFHVGLFFYLTADSLSGSFHTLHCRPAFICGAFTILALSFFINIIGFKPCIFMWGLFSNKSTISNSDR